MRRSTRRPRTRSAGRARSILRRTAARLADFSSPVLLLAGEVDVNTPPPLVAEFAALFPQAEVVVQPGAGHYPWLDDADWFSAAVTAFLADAPDPARRG